MIVYAKQVGERHVCHVNARSEEEGQTGRSWLTMCRIARVWLCLHVLHAELVWEVLCASGGPKLGSSQSNWHRNEIEQSSTRDPDLATAPRHEHQGSGQLRVGGGLPLQGACAWLGSWPAIGPFCMTCALFRYLCIGSPLNQLLQHERGARAECCYAPKGN